MSDGTWFTDSRPRPSIALPLHTELQGRFAIGRLLGRPGGFGITYLALDRHLDRTVALKEFFPRQLAARDANGTTVVAQTHDDSEPLHFARQRFLHEARTLARFDHQGIVRVQDFFEANGTAYLVMPYYEGQTLEARLALAPGGRVSEQEAVLLMLQVLNALQVVHGAGLLHRDIKPENIYLRQPTGLPTLLDFGSAKTESALRSRTVERSLTPGYAAVEQYITDGVQGPWTDLYACGATLYRLLTGQTPPEALARLGNADPLPAVAALAPNVSAGVAACVAWALQPQATARPQDAQSLERALLQAINSPGTVPTPLSVTQPVNLADVTRPVNLADVTKPVNLADARIAAAPQAEPRAKTPARSKRLVKAGAALAFALVILVSGFNVIASRVSVTGVVQTAAGQPLQNVYVTLTDEAQQTRAATTDLQGNFRIGWIRQDRQYRMAASLAGYHINAENNLENADYEAFLTGDTYVAFRARTHQESYAEYAVLGDTAVVRGIRSRDEGQVASGVGLLNIALNFFPDSLAPRDARMRGRWYIADYAGCLEDLDRMGARASANFDAWCNLGAGNYEKAARSFQSNVATNTTSADPHIGLSIIQYRQGAKDAAIQHYANAVKRVAAFAGGRSGIQNTTYYYNPNEWAAIDAIYRDFSAGLFHLQNDCRRPIRLAVHYRPLTGTWRTNGWWTFAGNSGRYLSFTDEGFALSTSMDWYYYAETTDGSNLSWNGNFTQTLNGTPLRMRKMENGHRLQLTCP